MGQLTGEADQERASPGAVVEAHPIYLDHNATTPILPEVVDAMLPYLREHHGNPSSGHVYGVRAREGVALARAQVAELLGCDPREIVFTSGGTESNNLAIRGATEARRDRRDVVTTVIEHPATAGPCAWLQAHGASVSWLGVGPDGRVLVEQALRAIDGHTALVSVMHSNNETGVVQPIAELAAIARACGAVMHSDAAQSVGKVPVRVNDLGVDLLSVAGHKLYAPKGVGALYVRHGTRLVPFALGAGHEGGVRPGTENVASIVGLGAACAAASRDLELVAHRTRRLRDLLWNRITSAISGVVMNGAPDLRLPNTLNLRFPEVSGAALLTFAPEIAASTGSACHDGHETASAVIVAMGVTPQEAVGSVRLTLGRGSTESDVERASVALVRAWRALTG